MRARVIGEGGNLGITQLARIEFSKNGGRINTDAIDNSAGVDMSDHEVNLKILLHHLVEKQILSQEESNNLLRDIAPEVVEHVLTHNKNHALLLTLGETRSKRNIEYFRSLILEITKLGFVDRNLEHLPDDDELSERASQYLGITRPELAICLAAVKMLVKDTLLKSKLVNDPLLKSFLLSYFPKAIQERFKDKVLTHPLAENIIATQVTNSIIDQMGVSFVHRMCIGNSVPAIIVIKCAIAAEFILHMNELRPIISSFENFKQNEHFFDIRREVGGALRNASSWLLTYYRDHTLQDIINRYQTAYLHLRENADEIFAGMNDSEYSKHREKYDKLEIDDSIARGLSLFPYMIPVFEILWSASKTDRNIVDVGTTFFAVIQELGIESILALESQTNTINKWENELLNTSFDDIKRSISLLTQKVLEKNLAQRKDIARYLNELPPYQQLQNLLAEIKEKTPSPAAISVVAKHLRSLHT